MAKHLKNNPALISIQIDGIIRRYWPVGLLALGIIFIMAQNDLLYDIVSALATQYQKLQLAFNSIGNFESDSAVWMPFLLITTLTILGIMFFPKPPQIIVVITTVFLAGSHTLYFLFRTFCTINLTTAYNVTFSIILYIIELVIYLTSLTIYYQMMFTSNRSGQADRYEQDIHAGRYRPSVDIFIPTYSEPPAMLKRTVVGCQAMDYRHKTIYLLDDGKRPEIKSLAEELHCGYLTRPDNRHAKAGNINHAFTKTSGELIAMFDADCVPARNFLSRTLGFFQEDHVALVITAQTFYNIKMYAHNLMSLMERSCFFRISQRGRDRFNALLCFGTCFVVRRTAMENIGGMPTETLSEDWATSIKLQACGYKTYMLDEVLGASAVAESMNEFVQQRVRWTQGTLQALFASTNPLTIKGLSLSQRFIHLYGILHYLITPTYIIIILMPLLYFLTGITPFDVTRGQFWFFFMPFLFFNIISFSWITGEYTSKISSLICESFMTVPISIAVFKTMVKPFGWRFRVTQKGVYYQRTTLNWFLGGPQIAFIVIILTGIIYGFRNISWYGSPDLFYLMFYFSIARLFFIWLGLYSAHDFPQQRKSPRFDHPFECLVHNKTSQCRATIINISETGALIKYKDTPDNLKYSEDYRLDIPQIELSNLPIKTARQGGHNMAVIFKDLDLESYRKIIAALYCAPGAWKEQNHLDREVFQAMGKALCWHKIFENREKNVSPAPKAKQAVWTGFLAVMLTLTTSAALADTQTAGIPKFPPTITTTNPKFLWEDPQLADLRQKMFAHNHEFASMKATLERLRAEYAVSRSALFPVVHLELSAGLHRDANGFDDPNQNDYQLSAPASYELDIWGRLKDKSQSSLSQAQSAQADTQALRIALEAELVERYYLALAVGKQLSLIEQAIDLRQQTQQLLEIKLKSGLIAQNEVLKNSRNTKSLLSESSRLARQFQKIENSLMILIGQPPQSGWLKGNFDIPSQLWQELPVLGDDWLALRPDIKALALKVKAAEFETRFASKDRLPRAQINADVQNRAKEWENFSDNNATGWGVFGKVKVPIFDGWSKNSTYQAMNARQKAMTEDYNQALLVAQGEVADAVETGIEFKHIVAIARERADLFSEEITNLQTQADAGLIDAIEVLNHKSEQLLSQAEDCNHEMAFISSRIQLYRALGQFPQQNQTSPDP